MFSYPQSGNVNLIFFFPGGLKLDVARLANQNQEISRITTSRYLSSYAFVSCNPDGKEKCLIIEW